MDTALIERAADPLAAVLQMCEQGRAALVRAVSVVEAREVLAAISTLEHAVKVRDMNQEAVIAASTLRIRAERRVGELLAAQATAKIRPLGRPSKASSASRLSDQGITWDESSNYQRLAAAPPEKFERAIGAVAETARTKRAQVTREGVMRELDPAGGRTPSDSWKDADHFKSACERLVALADAAVAAIRWKHFPGPEAGALGTTAMLLAIHNARAVLDRVEKELRGRR